MTNNKTIFFIIGILQIILGFFMIFPIMAQIIYNEFNSTFVNSAIITIISGSLFCLSNLDQDKKINLQQAFLLTSLSWISVAIFGSFPFFLSDMNFSFSDSFFESMSGITTTGSTIIENLQNMPKGLLLWRAILQWLGGIGIVLMAITLMPLMKIGGMQLFKIDSSDSSEKILPKSREIALRIFFIYLFLTILCLISYFFSGMNMFDSITHSMTTIATGGFSNYNESIGFFKNPLIEVISIIFIIAGSIPFIAYLKYISGNKKIFFDDIQIKGLFKICVVATMIMLIYLVSNNDESFLNNLRISTFNVVSILSGTGYVTSNFDLWGEFSLVFFLILMFIGGCAGSTACGIKIFRIQILWIFIKNQIKKIIYPRGIFPITYNSQKINEKFMSSIISFIFLYFLIFFIISILLSLTGLNFITSISGAATAISNVGPGLGEIIGPNGSFKDIPIFSKWVLSIGMLLGRLEIFALLVLFFPNFWRN